MKRKAHKIPSAAIAGGKTTRSRPASRISRGRTAQLDKMISEAVIDCYNESEEATAFFCVIEENLAVPFTTTLLNIEVMVERIELNDADEVVAVCKHGRGRQRISLLDLPLPVPKPKGAEWIDAYRRWARRR